MGGVGGGDGPFDTNCVNSTSCRLCKDTQEQEQPRSDGLSGWVITHEKGLILGEVAKEYRMYITDSAPIDPL